MLRFAKLGTRAATLFATVALVACGGGGGGGSSSAGTSPGGDVSGSVVPTYVFGSDVFIMKTIVAHAANDPSTLVSIGSERAPFSATSVVGLDDMTTITVESPVNKYTLSIPGLVTGGIYRNKTGSKSVRLGGTSWKYSRYGMLSDVIDVSNVGYTEISIPFWTSRVSAAAPKTAATYATDGVLIGTFAMDKYLKVEVQCKVSAKVTYPGASAIADLTLTDCINDGPEVEGFVANGTLQIASVISSQVVSSGGVPFTLTLPSRQGAKFQIVDERANIGRFVLAGPASEELVGSGQISGTVVANGISQKGLFTFAYGAKKS